MTFVTNHAISVSLQSDAPNPALIPETDLVGVTVVLIVCSYNEQEFVRVGYYVNNEYDDPELKENPPEKPDLTRVIRNILSEKPRVTRVPIKWDNVDENPPPQVDEADVDEEGIEADDDEMFAEETSAPMIGMEI